MKICVVDERSEIAACHLGIPQNDMGMRADVLAGCSKSEGMMLMLRSMSPQIIAVDELGKKADFRQSNRRSVRECVFLVRSMRIRWKNYGKSLI